MAKKQDEEEEKLKDLIVKKVLDLTSPPQPSGAGGGEDPTLLALLSSLGDKKSSDQSLIEKVLLLRAIAPPQPQQSGVNFQNMMGNLMMYQMFKELMSSNKNSQEFKLDDILKYKLIMSEFGGNKATDIEQLSTIMKLFQNNEGKSDKVLEYLKQKEERDKITTEHKKEIESLTKKQDEKLETLRSEILQLYQNLSNNQNKGNLIDQLDQIYKLQQQVQQYAEKMGWGRAEGLPEQGEQWQPAHFLKAIESIAQIAGKTVGAFTQARPRREPKTNITPRSAQQQSAPAPQQPQAQAQPQPQPQPQADKVQKETLLPQEIKEYLDNLKETEDGGIVDQYGMQYKQPGAKLTKQQFYEYALQHPEDIKQSIEASKQEYEKQQRELQRIQEQRQKMAEQQVLAEEFTKEELAPEQTEVEQTEVEPEVKPKKTVAPEPESEPEPEHEPEPEAKPKPKTKPAQKKVKQKSKSVNDKEA